MPPLARRNLFHDRIRLVVTLTGIAFSVVLMVVQWGLFEGFSSSTSGLIDHSKADLWIAAKNTAYLEQAIPFNERKYYQVLATPGVGKAIKYIVRWSIWKQPGGRAESVAIVGCDPDAPMGAPFNLVAGDVQQLKQPNAVIIDRIYADKLDAHHIGDMVEINGYRAKVVGFTDGIRAFTTSPYVFTTFKRALDFTVISDDQTNFILVQATPGVDVKQLKAELQRRLPDNAVFETAEFSASTRHYWMFTTGAGIAVLSRQYAMACEQLRTVGLSTSAPEKLARLLLDWSETGQTTEAGTRFRFTLTHGEIGEFIGTSRETVTRTLSDFRSRKLVAFHGSSLTIPSRSALESFARC